MFEARITMDKELKLDKSDTIATLQDINYLKYTPKHPLSDYVQAIWFAYKTENQGRQAFRLLSDCGSCIIMNFSDHLSLKRNNKMLKVMHETVAVGPSKDLFEITFIDKVNTLGINFHPGAGSVFLEGGIEPLIDSIEKCHEQNFPEISKLYNVVSDMLISSDHGFLFEQVENLLNQRLSHYLKQAKFKFEALLIELNQKRDMPLDTMVNMSGLSKRELQRKFKHYIGISPQLYQRIIKLNRVKGQISKGEFESLTQLALDNGYFDQAHFIRDFKFFMKLTPKEYRKLKHDN